MREIIFIRSSMLNEIIKKIFFVTWSKGVPQGVKECEKSKSFCFGWQENIGPVNDIRCDTTCLLSLKRPLVGVQARVSITWRYNGIIATKPVSKPSLVRAMCAATYVHRTHDQWSKCRRGFRVPLCNTRSSQGSSSWKFAKSRVYALVCDPWQNSSS